MSRFFAWIISESMAEFVSTDNGLSPSYALPVAELPNANEIVGAYVYIIIRTHKSDFAFARVSIDSIECCEDENGNVAGHLLNIDLALSCRLIRSCRDINAGDYRLNGLADFPIGLSPIPDNLASDTDYKIKSNVRQLINRFSPQQYNRINPPINHCCATFADKIILSEISSRFAISEIWGSMRANNPIANLGIEYLKLHPTFVTSGNVVDVISRLSQMPVLPNDASLAQTPSEPVYTTGIGEVQPLPEVDISLRPITPNNVRIRKFIARKITINVDEMLQKTESAEKRHQEMLKDIATYLLDEGERVFQSESIDMAIKQESGLLVFELKSINESNAFSQVAKGFFQLMYYADALSQCGVIVAGKGLIVESNMTDQMSALFSRILSNAGIELYLYDRDRPWPLRVSPNLVNGKGASLTQQYSLDLMGDYDEAASKGDSKDKVDDGYKAGK